MKYFPFTENSFRAEVGLKLLDLKDWLEPDENAAEQLAMKADLVKNHRDTVIAVSDETEALPAANELIEVLRAHLNLPPVAGFKTVSEALIHTSTLVQEDFCLISPESGLLIAGIVCFPSRWKIADKIGKASDGIHEPVPHFQPIARQAAGVLKALTKPMWRMNWTIHDACALFSPDAHHLKPEPPIIPQVSVRIERQTLRRLDKTKAIVFSIRTYIHPLKDVLSDPERKRILTKHLSTLPVPVAEYKGMRHFFETLKEELAR